MDIDTALSNVNKSQGHKRKWIASDADIPIRTLRNDLGVEEDAFQDEKDYHPELQEKRIRISVIETEEYKAGTHRERNPYVQACLLNLPLEVLQHILSFLDPLSLGRIVRVSRTISSLLVPGGPLPRASPKSSLPLLDQTQIWTLSRRRNNYPGFPRPMSSMSELDSFRLYYGQKCQYCGKAPMNKSSLITTVWNPGPGPDGVNAIWPFGIRSCGACLEKHLIRESELLLTRSSILIPGLPFAIFTKSFHYVTSHTLQKHQPPPRLQLTKCYFRPQLAVLEKESDEARSHGEAALEEWYKGLENLGKQRMDDAFRFENWISRGDTNERIGGKISGPRSVISPSVESKSTPGIYSSSQSPMWSVKSSGVFSYSAHSPGTNSPVGLHSGLSGMPLHRAQKVHSLQPWAPGSTMSGPTQVATQVQIAHIVPHGHFAVSKGRVDRQYRDIAQMKAERRTEIERRCQLLVPPLKSSTLIHMDAFNAAIQIPMALNENAWNLLRDRLLSERAQAERKELDHLRTLPISGAQNIGLTQYEERQQTAREIADRVWAEVRRPVRDKLRDIATEHTHRVWADGEAVTQISCAKFAADTLLYVRQHYHKVLEEEDSMLASRGLCYPRDPHSLASRRLKLDDMKWTFDEMVRPYTEKFAKEVFTCSACDINNKHFSFDAMIQHYAAKHTSALSQGSATVYWKAEWPADPPFNPYPSGNINSKLPTIPYQNAAYPIPPILPATQSTELPPPAYSNLTSQFMHSAVEYTDELVREAREMWDAIASLKGISPSVRLYITIQHVALYMLRKFNAELSLSVLMECIRDRTYLQPLRELTGLRCRECSTNPIYAGFPEYRRRLYSFLQLLEHFQTTHRRPDLGTGTVMHSKPNGFRPGDAGTKWLTDMIELPDQATIQDMMECCGMDDKQRGLMANAVRSWFPTWSELSEVRSRLRVGDPNHPDHYQQPGPVGSPLPTSQVIHSSPRENRRDWHHRPTCSPTIEYDPSDPTPMSVLAYGQDISHQRLPFQPGTALSAVRHRPSEHVVQSQTSHHMRNPGGNRAITEELYERDSYLEPRPHHQARLTIAHPAEVYAEPIPTRNVVVARAFRDYESDSVGSQYGNGVQSSNAVDQFLDQFADELAPSSSSTSIRHGDVDRSVDSRQFRRHQGSQILQRPDLRATPARMTGDMGGERLEIPFYDRPSNEQEQYHQTGPPSRNFYSPEIATVPYYVDAISPDLRHWEYQPRTVHRAATPTVHEPQGYRRDIRQESNDHHEFLQPINYDPHRRDQRIGGWDTARYGEAEPRGGRSDSQRNVRRYVEVMPMSEGRVLEAYPYQESMDEVYQPRQSHHEQARIHGVLNDKNTAPPWTRPPLERAAVQAGQDEHRVHYASMRY